MFSKDSSHYRAVPRTLNQAFGPYSKLEPCYERRILGRMTVALGVISLGVIYGLLMGWRG